MLVFVRFYLYCLFVGFEKWLWGLIPPRRHRPWLQMHFAFCILLRNFIKQGGGSQRLFINFIKKTQKKWYRMPSLSVDWIKDKKYIFWYLLDWWRQRWWWLVVIGGDWLLVVGGDWWCRGREELLLIATPGGGCRSWLRWREERKWKREKKKWNSYMGQFLQDG